VSVTQADTGSRPGGLGRRVVLVAGSAGLAAVLGHLLGPGDRLSRLESLRDLADGRALEGADMVVLDLPGEDRAVAVGHVRRAYGGPLVVLAGEGEDPDGSGLDVACTLVARPFSVESLRAALAGRPRPLPPAAAPAAAVAAPAAGPGRHDLAGRAQRLLIALVEGWRTQRQVRVAGFAALAVAAFTVAFILAVQGRCGPGCGQLGTGLSPAPTIAPVESRAASSTGPRHPTSTTVVRAGSPGAGAFLGTSERRRAATTTTTSSSGRGPATTTTRRQAVTTRPATTRPATTRPPTTPSTAPPTTGPTTTQPPPTTAPTTELETS
jgi:hypothetical protein